MTEGRRLVSVFLAPNGLFEDLREKPRWVVPYIILIIVAALTAVLTRLLIPADVLLTNMQANLPPGVEMGTEQMEAMVTQMRSPLALSVTALTMMVVNTLLVFLAGLLFWALFAIFGGKVNFNKSLSVVSYSGLITVLGMIILSVLAISLRRVDIRTSLAILPFLEPGTFLYRFASQIEFFAIWRVILMGLGFTVITEVSRWKSYILVIIPWLCLSLGMAALSIGIGR